MTSAFSCSPDIDLNDPAKAHKLSQVKDLKIEYYDISGEDAQQLRKQMDTLGPADLEGRSRDAFTQWHVKWSWPFDKAGKPVFSKAKSTVKFKVVLPRWIPSDDVEPKVVKSWVAMYRAMLDHEYNHVKLALEGTPKVSEAVREAYKLNPELSSKQAHAAAKKQISVMRKADLKYDKDTKSGQLEGVIFR